MNKELPTVSVILPTYNRANLLKQSIQSILSQTYKDFELIIVDDGSTDNTKSIVESISDNRIKYICSEKNQGAAEARNVGIQKSRGSLLAFQDSDDEWVKNKLETQMKRLASLNDGWGMIYSDMLRILSTGKKINWPAPTVKKGEIINLDKMEYAVAFIAIQTCLIKRECLNRVGIFNGALRALEDLELFIRITRHYDICHIQEQLVNYYDMGEGVSASKNNRIKARKKIMSLHRKYLKNEKEFLAHEYHYYSLCHLDEYLKYKKLSGICLFFFYTFKEKIIKLSAAIKGRSLKGNVAP